MNKEIDKEIDLFEVLFNTLSFIKRNKIKLIVFLILGLAIGIWQAVNVKPYYLTSFIGRSNSLNNAVISYEINNLQSYFDESYLTNDNNINEISKKLNLSLENIHKIRHIESEINKDIDEKTFIIKLEVYDNSVLDSLCNSIIYYLENNKYFKNIIDLEKAQAKDLISKIDIEIGRFEKNEVYSTSIDEKKSSSSNTNDKNTKLEDKEVSRYISLYKEKQLLEKEFLINAPIQINMDCIRSLTPENKIEKVLSFIKYFLSIMILGVLFILVLEMRKKYIEFQKQTH